MITRMEWLTIKAALAPLCPHEARELKALERGAVQERVA